MAYPTISTLPPAPQRTDTPTDFSDKADAWVSALAGWTVETNIAGDYIEQAAVDAEQDALTAAQAASDAEASAFAAASSANFAGEWSSLTGAYNVPTSVFHNNTYWNLVNDVADITTSEPSSGNTDWVEQSSIVIEWNDVQNKPTFALVATSGDYNNLNNRPTLGTMAPLNISTESQIRSLSGSSGITPTSLKNSAKVEREYTSWTPDWGEFIYTTWSLTSNRTLPNPTGVIEGTTRVVRAESSSSTPRTISFDSNYKGASSITVTDSNVALITMFAASSNEIVVSIVEYSI